MAVSLKVVQSSNASLSDLGPNMVGVFVGGTSGIGESTLKAFAKSTISPRLYVVGRNKASADRIIEEVKIVNPSASISFVGADLSELKNVDRVCEQIKMEVQNVNLLILTAGYLSLKGREESSDGLDRKFAVYYYARMRMIQNLLPLLRASSAASPPQLSRVLSVNATGSEGPLNLDDLDLQHSWTLSDCDRHHKTMTSLMVEEYAKREIGTAFVHANPGIVKTNLGSRSGFVLHALTQAAWYFTIALGWCIDLEESGERNLYAATAAAYPPSSVAARRSPVSSAKAQAGVDIARGSNGKVASGAYLLMENGNINEKSTPILDEFRGNSVGQKVWEHTNSIFDRT